jgi:hypothetical protein
MEDWDSNNDNYYGDGGGGGNQQYWVEQFLRLELHLQ